MELNSGNADFLKIRPKPAQKSLNVLETNSIVADYERFETMLTRHVAQGARGIAGRRVREGTHALDDSGGS